MTFPHFEEPGPTVPIVDALGEIVLGIPKPSTLPLFSNLAAGTPHGTIS